MKRRLEKRKATERDSQAGIEERKRTAQRTVLSELEEEQHGKHVVLRKDAL